MTFPVRPRTRWTVGLGSALAVGAAAGLLALGWNDSGNDRPAPITPSNIAGRPTVCLTGETTEADGRTDTNTIWTSLQEASRQSQLNVQRLFVPASTADQALPYLAGLAAQHCALIVAVGPTFAQALDTAAKANPHSAFLAVATDGQPAPAGVGAITGSDTDKAAEVRRRALALPSPGH
ncbi:hypothetical protein ACIBCA_27270 [Kitasatospora sp. NPDC051170]|uniref:hypothetical protein n=1 Tax=Kitasatospora sp. NPDC051170 TaxID=3364056 RepID=UPI0037A82342